MSKYRILSLDGGGIRGLMTVILLQRLIHEHGLSDLIGSADLLAGTSSGGLVALGLAHGLGGSSPLETLSTLERTFEDGRTTFGRRRPWWLGGAWLKASYGSRARENRFRSLLTESTLGELQKKVLIATFDLREAPVRVGDGDAGTTPQWRPGRSEGKPAPGLHAARKDTTCGGAATESRETYEEPHTQQGSSRRPGWNPKLYHNFKGPGGDRTERAWRVALRTTAAPLYFPTVDGHVDGAVYSNNPAMCALAQALDDRYVTTNPRALRDIVMLSVGSGLNVASINGSTHDWGILRWGRKYVELTLDGTVGIADYQCYQLLGAECYRRIEPVFPKGVHIGVDDVRKVAQIRKYAENVCLCEHAEWLATHWCR